MSRKSPVGRIYFEERIIVGGLLGGGVYALCRFAGQAHDEALRLAIGAALFGAVLGAYVLQVLLGAAVVSEIADGDVKPSTFDILESPDDYFPR